MIYIFWEEIKYGFANFLFGFRRLFCKSVIVNSHRLPFCALESGRIYCCVDDCPKRKGEKNDKRRKNKKHD